MPEWADGLSARRDRKEGETPDYYGRHGLNEQRAYQIVCLMVGSDPVKFKAVADEVSRATGKPILTATELAVADPDNPGPATVRRTGRLCYASANRAVTALGHLYRYADYRRRRGLP